MLMLIQDVGGTRTNPVLHMLLDKRRGGSVLSTGGEGGKYNTRSRVAAGRSDQQTPKIKEEGGPYHRHEHWMLRVVIDVYTSCTLYSYTSYYSQLGMVH